MKDDGGEVGDVLMSREVMVADVELVLASASPRRAELMRGAGYGFEVMVSPVEEPERRPRDIPLELWPTALAFVKAFAVQKCLRGNKKRAVVVGADTIVVLHEKVLGKPRDRGHARKMLEELSGRRHEVVTGLAVLCGKRYRLSRAVSVCKIKRLSKTWLEEYLDSGLWKGKAGAYGIQDHDPFVELVSGEWSNVVGLPLELLGKELAAMADNSSEGS